MRCKTGLRNVTYDILDFKQYCKLCIGPVFQDISPDSIAKASTQRLTLLKNAERNIDISTTDKCLQRLVREMARISKLLPDRTARLSIKPTPSQSVLSCYKR
ncbi:hypothetical protein KC19_8G101300 [Ceratodon purpureus]|uniref:Uncharacterized protein n=1 Tax=Ceratodon purpureus TaxID=3225 RepID=A0A8T0H2J2_CERPU|nr:hypothetical protein KC19_8G101300 [Ceratodon purpureus]